MLYFYHIDVWICLIPCVRFKILLLISVFIEAITIISANFCTCFDVRVLCELWLERVIAGSITVWKKFARFHSVILAPPVNYKIHM